MSLSAIQVVQPSWTGISLRSFVRRIGRLALLYTAIAAIGATITLFSFLLTWQNLALALVGLAAGLLGVVHICRIFLEVLIVMIRQLKIEIQALTRAWSKLGIPAADFSRELNRRRFDGDSTQPIPEQRRLFSRHLFAYASAGFLAPILAVLANASMVFRWSSMAGAVVGIALLSVARVIFHVHRFGMDRGRRSEDVDVSARR